MEDVYELYDTDSEQVLETRHMTEAEAIERNKRLRLHEESMRWIKQSSEDR